MRTLPVHQDGTGDWNSNPEASADVHLRPSLGEDHSRCSIDVERVCVHVEEDEGLSRSFEGGAILLAGRSSDGTDFFVCSEQQQQQQQQQLERQGQPSAHVTMPLPSLSPFALRPHTPNARDTSERNTMVAERKKKRKRRAATRGGDGGGGGGVSVAQHVAPESRVRRHRPGSRSRQRNQSLWGDYSRSDECDEAHFPARVPLLEILGRPLPDYPNNNNINSTSGLNDNHEVSTPLFSVFPPSISMNSVLPTSIGNQSEAVKCLPRSSPSCLLMDWRGVDAAAGVCGNDDEIGEMIGGLDALDKYKAGKGRHSRSHDDAGSINTPRSLTSGAGADSDACHCALIGHHYHNSSSCHTRSEEVITDENRGTVEHEDDDDCSSLSSCCLECDDLTSETQSAPHTPLDRRFPLFGTQAESPFYMVVPSGGCFGAAEAANGASVTTGSKSRKVKGAGAVLSESDDDEDDDDIWGSSVPLPIVAPVVPLSLERRRRTFNEALACVDALSRYFTLESTAHCFYCGSTLKRSESSYPTVAAASGDYIRDSVDICSTCNSGRRGLNGHQRQACGMLVASSATVGDQEPSQLAAYRCFYDESGEVAGIAPLSSDEENDDEEEDATEDGDAGAAARWLLLLLRHRDGENEGTRNRQYPSTDAAAIPALSGNSIDGTLDQLLMLSPAAHQGGEGTEDREAFIGCSAQDALSQRVQRHMSEVQAKKEREFDYRWRTAGVHPLYTQR